jgi:hypothetical protein
VNVTVPESIISNSSDIFYVVFVLLTVLFVLCFTIAYYFSKNKNILVWSLKYIRLICTLFVTVLYIPIITLFSSLLLDCSGNSHGCWSRNNVVRSVLVIITGFLYIWFMFSFSLSVFQRNPNLKENSLARPHSRIEASSLVIKAIISIAFVGLKHQESLKWILVLLCLLGSSSMFGLYTWFLPFFSWKVNLVKISTLSLFVWASVCLALSYIFQNPENSFTVAFFVISPFAIILSSNVSNRRKEQILVNSLEFTHSPYLVELKTRLIWEEFELQTEREKKEQNENDQ